MTTRLYQNLDLQIERAGNGYRAHVLYSPAGQATADFILPLASFRPSPFSARQVRVKQSDAPAEPVPTPRQFGEALFTAVFTNQVGACLARSRDAAESAGAGLRINL